VDTLFIRPVVRYSLRKGWLTKDKEDKMRESLYKNAAVGAFHLFGLYIGWHEPWFFNKDLYFKEFPYEANETQRWYYMIYLSFWFQSIDFMLNITNKHYTVKRKDNAEMLVHHVATIALMLFSYYVDLTKVGLCVLMLHDVNDLLLETGTHAAFALDPPFVGNQLTFCCWFCCRYSQGVRVPAVGDGGQHLLRPVRAHVVSRALVLLLVQHPAQRLRVRVPGHHCADHGGRFFPRH
jgi:hypothetical protein